MKRLLIALDNLLPSHLEQFENSVRGRLEIIVKSPSEVNTDDLQNTSIVVGNIKPDLARKAVDLELLQLNSAGYDGYVKGEGLKSSVKLCTAVGSYCIAVSEHMLALTFELIRHLALYRDKQHHKDWSDCGKIISVEGAVIAVLGLGDIGSSYARKVKALGAKKVIGFRRNLADKPDFIDEVHTLDDLDKILPSVDIVAMVLPSTKETRGIINEHRLNLMKKGAYLINCGRGDAVDEEALLKALREGRIGGCASDVSVPEPLPQDHPLWSEPNFVLTPHVAGNFFLQETFERMIRIASGNVRAYLDGEALRNTVKH